MAQPPVIEKFVPTSTPRQWLLVVDDDPNLRSLLRLTLEDGDLGILEAKNGLDALAALAANDIAAVVLDWRMPEVDGFGVLQHMAGDPRLAEVPVVVVSAEVEDDERVAGLAKRPTQWLVKPFSPAHLLTLVEQVLAGNVAELQSRTAGTLVSQTRIATEAYVSESQLRRYVADLRSALEREQVRVAELEQARNDLRRLDELKSTFLDFLSHELRTPLHQMSVIDLLGEQPGADDRQILEVLRHGYSRLCEMVQRGLFYIEAASRTAPSEPRLVVDARVLLRTAIARVAGASERTSLCGAASPSLVTCERQAIEGVLSTLLENALQYSPPASMVDVSLRTVDGWLWIDILDQGVGFEPRDAERWFAPFSSALTPVPGQRTGLSLAIAHEIVRRHGGALTAASEGPGRGATFSLKLPRNGSST